MKDRRKGRRRKSSEDPSRKTKTDTLKCPKEISKSRPMDVLKQRNRGRKKNTRIKRDDMKKNKGQGRVQRETVKTVKLF